MNREQIKERIIENMANANLEIEDLRVQPDPYLGWNIVVVSSEFADMSYWERKPIALAGLEELTLEWLELLTPAELEWAGTLPLDSDLEDIPMWPEALARGKQIPEHVLFPSDLDEDLDRPIVATFYSLRGGVGRSTALAYTARILASRGRTVLCVDMDLEAPGLTALFGKEKEIREDQGLLSILLTLDQGERPDIQNDILRISETDELYCLPAGKPNANYARLLNFMDPEAWYREERNPLRDLMQILGHQLSFKPDVILLDARTGITPLNGPLLFDLADLAIIVFFPHPQTQIGTEALVRAMLAAHTNRPEQGLTPEPRFLVSPIPASKAPEVVQRYQHRAIEWISHWLSDLDGKRSEGNKIESAEITHFVPYREAIATSDGILFDRETWRDFEKVAEWVELFLPTKSEERLQQVSLSDSKTKVLDELQFSGGTAENQKNFLETFVETELVNKALQPGTPLVLGRKGTGKTAIFRRIMEDTQRPSLVVMSPSQLKRENFWVISSDGFESIEEGLTANNITWRQFWTIQTCISCYLSPLFEEGILPEETLASCLQDQLTSEFKVVRCIKKMLETPELGLLARDWFARLDSAAQSNTILLFDGLDTGFGSTEIDRQRQTKAIEGLLSFILDLGDNLQNFRFKVLLREDIWRKLRFENKSHFFGRYVTLSWLDQADFFKVALKQALQSSTFQQLVSTSINENNFLANYDYWSESQVFQVWNLLVGERMRGGKSAFTRNWVWNRLADGSSNRNPRALLQLFAAATNWEIREQSKTPYGKTVIRPRGLSSSLEKVSTEAFDALVKEEFPELQDLIKQLQALGRSPFEASKLSQLEEEVSLAREVGLLSVYEGTEDNVKRYKVPDLYLSGIGMTRKGQA